MDEKKNVQSDCMPRREQKPSKNATKPVFIWIDMVSNVQPVFCVCTEDGGASCFQYC